MTASQLLNVAVLGLGPRWQKRYAPVLHALHDHFRIRAVCDVVQERADQEARNLGCSAAAGPTELLESEEIDTLLLLDAAWQRLWPLELACRLGKPVFCAVPLEQDEEHAEALLQQVREHGLLVMIEMLPQLAPLTQRLRQLLDGSLGPAHMLLCDWVQRHTDHAAIVPDQPLLGATGGALLNWCAALLGATPVSAWAAEAPAAGLASVLLEFSEGRAVQIVRRRVAVRRDLLRFQVVAAHGQAEAEAPLRVQWTDSAGRHRDILPRPRPPLQTLLERFHQAVITGQTAAPDLDRAYRSLTWLRAIARSRTEGRKVEIE